MINPMKNIRYVLWGFVGLAFIIFIVINLPEKDTVDNNTTIMPLAGFNKGEHFTLQTHKGEIYSSDSEIKDGNYALLFFGFTHCPVICPTELQKFSDVMDELPTEVADKIQPIFITIDPERDDVAVMREYVPLFHEKIIGLTGSVNGVHKVLNEWKVFYTKVDDPQLSDYTMDHSTYSYLIDSEMNIKALFRMKTSSTEIAEQIQKMVR